MPNKSIPMIRTFRLFGEFQWPPSKPSKGDHERAAVEIWFVLDAEGKYQALLSWAKDELPGKPDVTFPDKIDNVFRLNEDDLEEHFSEKAGSLWISQGTVDKNDLGTKLQFKGAVLFEQFPDKDPTQIKLKWPLVRQFSYGR